MAGGQRLNGDVYDAVAGTLFKLKSPVLCIGFMDCTGAQFVSEGGRLRSVTSATSHLAVLVSDKLARVVSLPSQSTVVKMNLTDTSFVISADVMQLKSCGKFPSTTTAHQPSGINPVRDELLDGQGATVSIVVTRTYVFLSPVNCRSAMFGVVHCEWKYSGAQLAFAEASLRGRPPDTDRPANFPNILFEQERPRSLYELADRNPKIHDQRRLL